MVHLTTALDASSGVPLYEQLYRSLAGEMRSGTLAAGTRMPGKRRLKGIWNRGSAAAFMYRNIWPCRPGLPAGRNSPLRQNRNRLCCRCGTTFPPAG